MTKNELSRGMARLYDGFSHSRVDLTPERMDALFDAIGFHSAEIWESAVSALLCETRFPDFDMIETAIDRASEEARIEESRRIDEDAKRFFSGQLPDPFQRAGDHEYGLFRLKVLVSIMDGATPSDVAAMLESQSGRWPNHGLHEEAASYRGRKWGDEVQRPTWWDRQKAMQVGGKGKSLRALTEIVRGLKPADESWPGWGAV